MTSERMNRLKMRISREVAGTHIEVCLDDEEQLGEAFELLARLCERARNEELRVALSRLWVRGDESDAIANTVSERNQLR